MTRARGDWAPPRLLADVDDRNSPPHRLEHVALSLPRPVLVTRREQVVPHPVVARVVAPRAHSVIARVEVRVEPRIRPPVRDFFEKRRPTELRNGARNIRNAAARSCPLSCAAQRGVSEPPPIQRMIQSHFTYARPGIDVPPSRNARARYESLSGPSVKSPTLPCLGELHRAPRKSLSAPCNPHHPRAVRANFRTGRESPLVPLVER